jgi:hypothetical protein
MLEDQEPVEENPLEYTTPQVSCEGLQSPDLSSDEHSPPTVPAAPLMRAGAWILVNWRTSILYNRRKGWSRSSDGNDH